MSKSKKTKNNSTIFLSLISSLSAVVAIVMMFLPAYVLKTSTVLTGESVKQYSLFDLTFGCDVTTNSDGNKVVCVGLLIGFIALCLAGLLMLVNMVLAGSKAKKGTVVLLSLLSFLLAGAAGVLFFMTLKLTGLSTGTTDLYLVKGTAALGVGVYLAGAIAIVSALFALITAVAKLAK